MSPRAGQDGCGKSLPQRDSIPGPSSSWRVAIPSELFRPDSLGTGVISQVVKWPGLRLASHFRLVSKLRMSGALPPFSNISQRRTQRKKYLY